MSKYRIAIITAYIGDGGKTGELQISPEAQIQMEAYGIDIYRFNNNNINILKSYLKPNFNKNEIIKENIWKKFLYKYFRLTFRQEIVPNEADNYTRLVAKIPKILFYKVISQEYDYYIWLDSKFIIYKHWLDYILWIIDKHQDVEVIASKHSSRSSMKEEIDFMLNHIKNKEQWYVQKIFRNLINSTIFTI